MKKSSIAFIGLFLLIYILPLGIRPILVRDESRYAEIPREMLVSGDWVTPRLDGLRYFEKPVLGYWANAASMMLFGENSFAMRFPSAMAAGLSAILLFLLVRRFEDGYLAGIFAGAVFLTCLEVFAVGVFNVLDTLFSFFVTAAMVAFFYADMEQESEKKRLAFLAMFGFSCGLAFLTKGFPAFVIPAVSIGAFMAWKRRWKELFTLPWIPITAALLVILPWSVMIQIREHDFWRYFLWIEHVKRFVSATEGQHPQPFWYLVLIMAGGALPWTLLFPAAITGLRRTGLKDPLTRFAASWLLFPLLFFSASEGKLGTYVLPCFPPFVILLTVGLQKYLEEKKHRVLTVGVWFSAVTAGIALAGLILSQVSDLLSFIIYSQAETWKWSAATAGLLVCIAFLVLAARSSDSRKRLVLYCTAPILLMLCAQFIVPDRFQENKAPGAFLLSHSDRVAPDTILISDDYLISAVCWFYKRSDVYLLEVGGELNYGLSYDDSKHRVLTIDQFKRLANQSSGKNRVTLIMDADQYPQYRRLMPKLVFEDVNSAFVFAQF